MDPKRYEFIMDDEMTMEEQAILICKNENIEYCIIGITLYTRQDNTWYPVQYEYIGYCESDPVYNAIIYC